MILPILQSEDPELEVPGRRDQGVTHVEAVPGSDVCTKGSCGDVPASCNMVVLPRVPQPKVSATSIPEGRVVSAQPGGQTPLASLVAVLPWKQSVGNKPFDDPATATQSIPRT